ncbi:hypothetical protein CLF_109523 [Clonorchis sinensis]|uniref:Uncharacterized protein n=1 Tax=Clonorchis sinensis TaxID=79923 RepID=G7YJG5_CLOSI|nr:hypothetical protein CLF_109523 [Clonorchis sinensis]
MAARHREGATAKQWFHIRVRELLNGQARCAHLNERQPLTDRCHLVGLYASVVSELSTTKKQPAVSTERQQAFSIVLNSSSTKLPSSADVGSQFGTTQSKMAYRVSESSDATDQQYVCHTVNSNRGSSRTESSNQCRLDATCLNAFNPHFTSANATDTGVIYHGISQCVAEIFPSRPTLEVGDKTGFTDLEESTKKATISTNIDSSNQRNPGKPRIPNQTLTATSGLNKQQVSLDATKLIKPNQCHRGKFYRIPNHQKQTPVTEYVSHCKSSSLPDRIKNSVKSVKGSMDTSKERYSVLDQLLQSFQHNLSVTELQTELPLANLSDWMESVLSDSEDADLNSTADSSLLTDAIIALAEQSDSIKDCTPHRMDREQNVAFNEKRELSTGLYGGLESSQIVGLNTIQTNLTSHLHLFSRIYDLQRNPGQECTTHLAIRDEGYVIVGLFAELGSWIANVSSPIEGYIEKDLVTNSEQRKNMKPMRWTREPLEPYGRQNNRLNVIQQRMQADRRIFREIEFDRIILMNHNLLGIKTLVVLKTTKYFSNFAEHGRSRFAYRPESATGVSCGGDRIGLSAPTMMRKAGDKGRSRRICCDRSVSHYESECCVEDKRQENLAVLSRKIGYCPFPTNIGLIDLSVNRYLDTPLTNFNIATIIMNSTPSLLNTDASLPHNYDLFESLIVDGLVTPSGREQNSLPDREHYANTVTAFSDNNNDTHRDTEAFGLSIRQSELVVVESRGSHLPCWFFTDRQLTFDH